MSEGTPGGGHEILIIKKGGGHHDEHHGGVWKIAFADFMTAMMAFFLVMWLVSANDKTKAVIAKYFNPIELVDSTPQPRGLNDSKKDDPSVDRKPDAPVPDAKGIDSKGDTKPSEPRAENAKSSDAKDKEAKGKDSKNKDDKTKAEQSSEKTTSAEHAATAHTSDKEPLDDADASAGHMEIELLQDPYAVIAEIAEKKVIESPQQKVRAPPPPPTGGGVGAVGLNAGAAFRDPFEPQPMAPGSNPLAPFADVGPNAKAAADTKAADAGSAPAAALPKDGASGNDAVPPPTGAHASSAPVSTPQAPGTPASAASSPVAAAPAGQASGAGADDKPMSFAALRARIAALVKGVDAPASADGASGSGGAPKVEVRHTDEGTLISLTDSADYAMFASASARPSAKTVAMMARIGHLLGAQRGGITIRGFTDNHPFRSDTYDNWRLSTERAHIAQYMLVRGGLDDMRIDRVEGYADRRPKNVKDPGAAENRRIEILLRDSTP